MTEAEILATIAKRQRSLTDARVGLFRDYHELVQAMVDRGLVERHIGPDTPSFTTSAPHYLRLTDAGWDAHGGPKPFHLADLKA